MAKSLDNQQLVRWRHDDFSVNKGGFTTDLTNVQTCLSK